MIDFIWVARLLFAALNLLASGQKKRVSLESGISDSHNISLILEKETHWGEIAITRVALM